MMNLRIVEMEWKKPTILIRRQRDYVLCHGSPLVYELDVQYRRCGDENELNATITFPKESHFQADLSTRQVMAR